MKIAKLLIFAICLAGCSDPSAFKGDVRNLRFSPDGKQLLAIGEFSGKWKSQIYRISADGRAEHIQSLPENCISANWNANGTAINSLISNETSVIEIRSSMTFGLISREAYGPPHIVGEIIDVSPNHFVVAPQSSTNFDVVGWPPEMLSRLGTTYNEKHLRFGCAENNAFTLVGTGGEESVIALSYSGECPAEVWDVADLKMVKRYDLPISSECWLAISAGGQRLATLQRSKLIVWKLESENPDEILNRSFVTPPDEAMWERVNTQRLSFDKSGDLIAACSEDDGVNVINVNTQAVVFELKEPIQSCALSPDGKLIAVAYASKKKVEVLPTGL